MLTMATIIPNKKSGKITSFKFRAFLGRDENGKQIMRYTTWKPDADLSEKKAIKRAEKAATEWEKTMLFEYQKDLENPERVAERIIQKQRTPFTEFVEHIWFPVFVYDGTHKPTTIEFYRNITNKLNAYFSEKAIQTITAIDIQKYLIYLRTDYKSPQGKPLSDKTIKHHYCVLTLIFDYALKQDFIVKNPMDKVDCPALQKKKVDALTKEQVQTMFTNLHTYSLEFQCMVYLFIFTGIRRGELIGLQWGDIDFINNTISIKRNVTYTTLSGISINSPKTRNSIRVIPIINILVNRLNALKNSIPSIKNNQYIFHSMDSAFVPRYPDTVTKRIKLFMKNNGLPDMSPHDLRHTCATLMLGAGADIKSIQEILGHSNSSTTLNFYVGSDINRMKAATDKMEEIFNI